MFEDMIRSIERMRSEVTKLIGINEKAAFNQAEALIERLEQEIDELKKKETGLKQLYSTEDHIHFLQVICIFIEKVHKVDIFLTLVKIHKCIAALHIAHKRRCKISRN